MSLVMQAVHRRLGTRRLKLSKARRTGGIKVSEALDYLPPNPVVVEAGANDGTDTVTMADLWPGGRIHAFEPNPAAFQLLRERTEPLGNVRCYESALGSFTGAAQMWLSDNHGSSSLLAPKDHLDVFPDVTFDNQASVRSITLDDWAHREAIKGVDFLWLDMQGYELAALQHALAVLPSVRAIILEIFTQELYERAPLWPEVRAWLEGQGFSVVRTHVGSQGFGDALLKRQSAFQLCVHVLRTQLLGLRQRLVNGTR